MIIRSRSIGEVTNFGPFATGESEVGMTITVLTNAQYSLILFRNAYLSRLPD